MPMVNIQTPRNNSAHGVLGQNPIIRRPSCTERAIVVLVIVILSRRTILQFYTKILQFYTNTDTNTNLYQLRKV